MHPAFSILFFTTLAGAGQGLVVVLALALLAGVPLAPGFVSLALGGAIALLLAGLGASFLHLGHKLRAWRAVLMWRTSWMSREVIVLPAFIALAALWWLMPGARLLAALLLVGALVLWWCTGMIYACLRFVEEWAHPLTPINFTLIGLASGALLACTLAASQGETALLRAAGPWALGVTLAAWAARTASFARNGKLQHRSTLQSATGVHAPKLTQKSMGMSAGSFNTREFFHGASPGVLATVRYAFPRLAFGLPVLLMAWALATQATWPWLAALVVHAPGVLAERWYFFAQARHPQNLYYQTVS